jgi:hypothetical protein
LLAFRLSVSIVVSSRRALFAKSIKYEFENLRISVSSSSVILHDREELFKITGRREIKPLVFKNIQNVIPRSSQTTFLHLDNVPEKLLRSRATLAGSIGITVIILD